jgi:CBS domain-containing protein
MHYKRISIHTSEDARWHKEPLHEAIVNFVRDLKLAARCTVTRGLAGCYENGTVATNKLEILSYKMPLIIEIMLPAPELDRVLPPLQNMVVEGIIGVSDIEVVLHRTKGQLIPIHLRVRDVMTATPQRVTAATSVGDVVKILVAADFNCLPVVDDDEKPIGIITQGDLISRAGMPIRLGLLDQLDKDHLDATLQTMANQSAGEVMSHNVVTVADETPLTQAVHTMLQRSLKRLPVVDAKGTLVGILARRDIFHAVTTVSPDWQTLQTQHVQVEGIRPVSEIMRRDTHTVASNTPLTDVARVIDENDIQRVAVVDDTGRLLGLVFDRDLLGLLSGQEAGFWRRLTDRLTRTGRGTLDTSDQEQDRAQMAGDIMKTDLVTIREDAHIDDAIRLMTQRQIKRLPVVDAEGRFRGMISRDQLLRAGTDV